MLLHQPARDVPAGDEIIHVLQERLHARVEFIQVGDDRDAGGPRPACGDGRRGGIVPVHVKRTGIDNPFAPQFFRAKGQALVAFPKNGALAKIIHQNEGLLAGAARSREQMRLDAEARKFRAVKRCSAVVAHLADVARAQSPVLASHHGGGDLAARQDLRGTKFDLGSARRIVSNGDKRVGGVEPHADDVNLGRFGHLAGATLKDARKFSKMDGRFSGSAWFARGPGRKSEGGTGARRSKERQAPNGRTFAVRAPWSQKLRKCLWLRRPGASPTRSVRALIHRRVDAPPCALRRSPRQRRSGGLRAEPLLSSAFAPFRWRRKMRWRRRPASSGASHPRLACRWKRHGRATRQKQKSPTTDPRAGSNSKAGCPG